MTRRNFLSAAAASAFVRRGSPAPSRKPNIIVILCDDLGYGDLASYGSRISTPNLDRLASEGVRFTNFCSADPVCSPSRAALLTGRYPTRVGVPRVFFPQDKGGLNLDETTMGDMLKGQGYKTICIGKWHLGRPVEYLPTSRGFDEYLGIPYSNDMTPRVLMHDTEVIEDPAILETLTPRYTERAVRFINENKGSPFFLYLPHAYPHIPLAASDRFRGKSSLGLYGDVVEEIDWSVGEVMNAVRRNQIDQDTLILFTSDNGPWYQGSPGRLRGRKGSTFEGGIREPFIARWTGHIPGGRITSALGSMMDLFPTIVGLCGAPPPAKPLDGVDIWPLLNGTKTSVDREVLLYFDNWDLQCARWDDWKLHIARHNSPNFIPPPPGGRHSFLLPKPELYNIAEDPDESYDQTERHPEIVDRITKRIQTLIPGFPEPVREAWAAIETRKSVPTLPAGAWPHAAPQPALPK